MTTALALVLGIIGSILAALMWEGYRDLFRRIKLLHLRKIYGRETNFILVYSELSISPVIPEEMRQRPFVKPGMDDTFSAHRIACVCEVRAATYIVSSLAGAGRRPVAVISDVNWEHKARENYISFGATSNRCSIAFLENSELVGYDKNRKRFVSKSSGRCLHDLRSEKTDYGIIARFHPFSGEGFTWIACAGTGEYGTSGSAWYLGKQHKRISRQIQRNAKSFVCLISVRLEDDTSADMLFLEQTIGGIEDRTVPGCPGGGDISSCPHDCKRRISDMST